MTTRRDLMRTALAAPLAAGLAPALIGRARAAEPFKAAWVYVGPVEEAGYSFQHDLGRRAVAAKYGDKVKASYVENVPEGADAERIIGHRSEAIETILGWRGRDELIHRDDLVLL